VLVQELMDDSNEDEETFCLQGDAADLDEILTAANGQNQLKDKIFRMGTLGFVSQRDVLTAIASLEASLHKLGHKFELGSGVAAAIKVLSEVK